MFKKLDPKRKYTEMETEVLSHWNENKIFEKSVENRSVDNIYSFYDGPPFATGTPHYGHIVASVIKDVVPRFWTMKGFRVERRWGWDCHGLPIENIAEKELGISQKKEIEALGVEKFNETCRKRVLAYVDDWKHVINRLGRWADMENDYKTMDKDFMESVWWVFKELYDADLVYESYRSMHICPRCETTLSQSEVSEGYKDIKDLSATARFHLKAGQEWAGGKYKTKDAVYILAWTTTPWTLIGNVALAVGEDVKYTALRVDDIKELLIVASDRVQDIFKDREIEVVHDDVTGKDLVGLEYQPLFDYYAADEKLRNRENGWKVYAGDFVNTEEGTGIVHIAPAFGDDDMKLGKENNLPFVQHVAMNGSIDEKAGEFAGLNVKPRGEKGEKDPHQKTDIEIIKYLAHKGLLFAKEKYEHSYPHCWRCDTPLLNYATTSWFVSVTKIKEKMLEYAKDINWSPENIKEGRWGNWLEGARDWSISRQRYWASVIPLWRCECGEIKVIGSVEELEKLTGEKINDLHKHTVDKLTFSCSKCQGTMKRIPDVLDCWFESGSMPYAQNHYPFENKEKAEQSFPANFIAEGIDQTRAWFYYLHVIASGIKKSRAFDNVVVNGIVLAEDGKKMSKRLQNYPDPMEMLEKYGADVLRFYLVSSPVVAAQNLNFAEKELAELSRGTFRMIMNSYSFFMLYANIDKWEPKNEREFKPEGLLDRWMLSELHKLTKEVTKEMEAYRLHKAARLFLPFVDNLSNWYIRRSRRRFWKSESDSDKNDAYQTLWTVLVEFSKLIAPFTPFVADEIYRNLTGEESVHLADYPIANEKLIDEEISKKMASTRKAIEFGLNLRAENKLKVRQPLNELLIFTGKVELEEEYLGLIKDEVNVKNVLQLESKPLEQEKVVIKEDLGICVSLDLEITKELQLEGDMRELVRFIQSARKKAGFEIEDRIELNYIGGEEIFAKFEKEIVREVLAKKMENLVKTENFDYNQKILVNGTEIEIWLTRLK